MSRALARAVRFLEGHPHPGQRYRHGWIPIAGTLVQSDGSPRFSRLADAKTTVAIEAAASEEAKRITGRSIPFDYGDVDPQLAREYSEGVLRGLERFPSAPLGAVRVADFGPERDQGDFTWAHTLHDSHTSSGQYEIEFNRRGEVAQRANEILDMKKARGIFAYSDVAGLALHEFGHVMHEHYGTSHEADRLVRAYADANVAAPIPAPGKRRFGIGPRKPGELTEDQVREHRDEKRTFLLREISFYSTHNSHEMTAEAFADSMTNGDKASPLSRQIMDLLESKVRQERAR